MCSWIGDPWTRFSSAGEGGEKEGREKGEEKEGSEAVPMRPRAAFLGVAATAIAVAAGLVAVAIIAGPSAGRTELNVYQDKYRDVHAGGVWMDCLKCRHESGHCHPTKSEAQGRRHVEANACPPHTGMTTVLMKRNGKTETKWIDKAVLQCAMKKMGEKMGHGDASPAEEEPAEAGAEGEDDDASPLCVRPFVGERAKWEAGDDCKSVADWLGGMGVYGDGRRRRLLSVPKSKLQQLDGDEEPAGDEDADGEEEEEAWDPEGKTAIENWGHDTEQHIYDTYYTEGGGDDEEPAEEEEPEEYDPCVQVTEDARVMPKKALASDCFGPPHTLCQIECAAECMRAPQTPNNMMLKSARMQMLFGPGELPIGCVRVCLDCFKSVP